eukprot:1703440-Karenia_brevis.AAC.1
MQLREKLLRLLARSMDVKRTVIELSLGRHEVSPFSEQLVKEGRDFWRAELRMAGMTLDAEADKEPAGKEVYCWRLLGAHLRAMDDPDWRIMAQSSRSFLSGVRLGPGCKLPRTPSVFERKVRWRRLDGMDDNDMPSSKENYSSALENVAAVEA